MRCFMATTCAQFITHKLKALRAQIVAPGRCAYRTNHGDGLFDLFELAFLSKVSASDILCIPMLLSVRFFDLISLHGSEVI
jgi:hypothetical protein